MKRPQSKTLWCLAITLFTLSVTDIALTTIGIIYFNGNEGNPLIVALAELLPGSSYDVKVVHMVWMLKITVMSLLLLAVRAVVKSRPERDDKLMFYGLACSLTIYVFVVTSWAWFFISLI